VRGCQTDALPTLSEQGRRWVSSTGVAGAAHPEMLGNQIVML
jgi:hypothetical protein